MYVTHANTTEAACVDECAAAAGCAGAVLSHVPAEGVNSCYLLSSIERHDDEAGLASWTKTGWAGGQ